MAVDFWDASNRPLGNQLSSAARNLLECWLFACLLTNWPVDIQTSCLIRAGWGELLHSNSPGWEWEWVWAWEWAWKSHWRCGLNLGFSCPRCGYVTNLACQRVPLNFVSHCHWASDLIEFKQHLGDAMKNELLGATGNKWGPETFAT